MYSTLAVSRYGTPNNRKYSPYRCGYPAYITATSAANTVITVLSGHNKFTVENCFSGAIRNIGKTGAKYTPKEDNL